MKKIIEGKIWTAVCVALTLLMIVSAIWIGMRYYVSMDIYETPSMFLEGEYSVDGGEWKPIEKDRYITDHFNKIVFKGKMSKKLLMYFGSLTISSKNVWYTLKTTDGTVIQSYNFDDEKLSYEHTQTDKPLALDMPNTPGYCVKTIYPDYLTKTENITEDSDLIFEVEYPYGYALVSYNDCVDVTAYYNEGMYLRFFYDALPPVLLFVLICFFGLFFFPVASFILGKIDYKYLTFGMLSFLWGLYMIMQQISGYLNLWIVDPTVCMMMDKITGYCFVAAVLFYFKANMSSRGTRIAANIASAVFLSCVFTVFILHLCHIRDLNASSMTMNFATAGSIVIMIVLLCVEMRINRNALFFLLSWVPLLLTVAIDAVDQFIHLPGSHYFNYGLAITMIVQIVRLIGDLRFQYKEAIRHQQMQKELYEAKVSVMTSQIRPHFMYNALTSIAMMCEIDPKIAKEATITFAKYLRGNMDSLKQTGPVPFTQELEHLKKYLYIEKLRFDDLLNIEYDIQATDFVLPLLSVQPLVENAVKHGVGMKEDGGTVRISTRETETAYEVVIEDDGVGFDVNEQKDDGRSHVGMENTKKRLHDMCGGEVKIESVVGKGTTAIVILPKEGQKNENTLS